MLEGSIPFGSRRIGTGYPVAVIAEIGINHEGNPELCAAMIRAAAAAGADAVKLQTIDPDENYVRGSDSYRLFSAAALTRETTAAMFDLTRQLGMEPLTTAGDFATIDWVSRLKPSAFKISSGLLTHLPVVRHAARQGVSLLMSTGMSELREVTEAIDAAQDGRAVGIGVFQCTSIYPAADATLDLAAIRALEQRFSVPAGFSDHSLGSDAAALAVAAGARMIEKHFSYDPRRAGYDHRISLDAAGLKTLVQRVRRAEVMMGTTTKRLTEPERRQAEVARRILVARAAIQAGERFSSTNLGIKRPLPGMTGLAPKHYETVLGRVAAKALAVDEAVSIDAIEGGL